MRTRVFRGAVVLLALAIFASAPHRASAVTYSDSTGDTFPVNGIMDITSVEVTHNATDIIFKINLNGNPTADDWGKYMIGIDSTGGGDSSGNAWARPISMPGMDWWIGSWADSGNGAEVWKYTGSWGLQSATYASNPDNVGLTKDTSSVTIKFAYAGLGLTTFKFDVYTSGGGGGDGAVDALGNPNQTIADWGNSYDSGTLVNTYTIPEPSSLVLVGMSGLMLTGLLFRRRA